MRRSSALMPNDDAPEKPITVDPAVIAHMTRNEADMAFKKRVQTIFEWVEPTDDKVILDMPCGRGFYLNMFRYVSNCKLIGAELDWDVILKAKQNVGHLPDIALHNCNIYALPYPDDTFDAVILSEVLEHIEDDVAGLREIYRVLKPGGVVAITVPNADYPFWWDPINKTLEFLFRRHISKGMFAGIWANHVRLYRRDELRDAVLAAGFLLEEERAFTHSSFPFIHNLVYGVGKPLLESGALPKSMATAADRTTFDQNSGSLLNPINLGIRVLNAFDRKNAISEPAGRSTVNLAAKGRKPADPAWEARRARQVEVEPAAERSARRSVSVPEMPITTAQYASEAPLTDDGFEDLTLADVVGRMRHAPLTTLRAVAAVAQTPTYAARPRIATPPRTAPKQSYAPAAPSVPEVETVAPPADDETVAVEQGVPTSRRMARVQLGVRVAAAVVAIAGSLAIFTPEVRAAGNGLGIAAPFWIFGFVLWLIGEVIPHFDSSTYIEHKPLEQARESLLVVSPVRIGAAVVGTICAALAWSWNDGNMFTLMGVITWVASIILWVWALSPAGWSPVRGVQSVWERVRRVRFRFSWTLAALVAIMIVGAYFRLVDLDGTPPEMTSDHVEKLLDVRNVLNGTTNVFFANNDGRDPIQFYGLALLAQLPGLELNHNLLKLMTVIEGLITLPVLWWMGRQIIGERDRRLGNLVGLIMAGMVAVSYWHEVLSLMGLRIVLTPLFTALVIGFLARGVRSNRRSDFIWAGLWLGIGLYAYQAIRMLPVAIIATAVIALVFGVRTWAARRQMFVNFAALVIISFVIFVPLLRFATEYPQDFMRRTTGRLFGEDGIREFDENGVLTVREPTLWEQIEVSVPQLVTNFGNAVMMYNFKSDAAWINNAPNFPAFDPFTGGLLIVGAAAWLARMWRRRDAFDWALIPIILIMMLASALSIAYPIENPSATRMSGTLPGVYLLTAFPLALIALGLPRVARRTGVISGVIVVVGVLALSLSTNWRTFFVDFRTSYIASSLPYSVGGDVLRDFAAQNGYGNAFIVAYPYWWDHRALAIEGGRIDWPNTITSLDDAPNYLKEASERGNDLRLDANRDLLFFYSPDDALTEEWLQANFPAGAARLVETNHPNKPFKVYTAPAIGSEGFAQFLERYDLAPSQG